MSFKITPSGPTDKYRYIKSPSAWFGASETKPLIARAMGGLVSRRSGPRWQDLDVSGLAGWPTSLEFLKRAKQIVKKHPSFKTDLKQFTDTLEDNPRQGVQIRPDVYKVRIAIKSKGRGKSNGARVITFVETAIIELAENITVQLVTVYDKADISNVT